MFFAGTILCTFGLGVLVIGIILCKKKDAIGTYKEYKTILRQNIIATEIKDNELEKVARESKRRNLKVDKSKEINVAQLDEANIKESFKSEESKGKNIIDEKTEILDEETEILDFALEKDDVEDIEIEATEIINMELTK